MWHQHQRISQGTDRKKKLRMIRVVTGVLPEVADVLGANPVTGEAKDVSGAELEEWCPLRRNDRDM